MGLFDRFKKDKSPSMNAEVLINSLDNESFQFVIQEYNKGNYKYLKKLFKVSSIEEIESAINNRMQNEILRLKSLENDPKFLKKLVYEGTNSEVQVSAVRKINDTSILLDILENSKHRGVLEEAVKKIDDESLLFDIAMDNKYDIPAYNHDPFVRFKAISKISDENLLSKIVLENNESKIYIKAIDNIKNEDLLLNFIFDENLKKDKKEYIFCHNLLSEDSLKEILLKSDDDFNRVNAIKNINDIEILKSIMDDANDELLIEIIRKIDDQEILKHYAINGNTMVRREAVIRVTDQPFVESIVRSDEDWRVRKNIITNFHLDEELLNEIALNDEDASVKSSAVFRISNENTLADIAIKTDDIVIRGECIRKIKDESILSRINHHIPLKSCPKCGSFRVVYSQYYDQSLDLNLWGNTCKNCGHKFDIEQAK